MGAPKLSARAIELIRAELRVVARGERAEAVRRLAGVYGVSAATVYRAAGVGGTRRARAAMRPEYREWTRTAVELAHRAPKPIPLDLALKAGVEGGLLPPEAAAMPVTTARRVARELGLVAKPKRTQRLHADYPMQAVLIDASTSEHLVAERPDGEDDWQLALHRRPWSGGGYKNKPLPAHRMRVQVYALWDMCTGYTLARYAVERGESALGAMEFLCWALAEEKGDPRLVLHGVPDDLWSDLGPLARSGAARDLLERLDINLALGEPYAKERMGGVERSHRTRWQRFERALFVHREYEKKGLRLSELNARLTEFTVAENGQRLSRTTVDGRLMSRTAAWVALTGAREEPLRRLPERPIETMAREARRRVDANGIVRWDGVEYEAGGGWCSRSVVARRAMDGSGDLTLEDEATGARQSARRYEPRRYGEVRSNPRSALEELLESGGSEEAAEFSADVWAPASAANLARFPARGSVDAAPLANPFETDTLGSLEEAWRVFVEVYPWPLSAANRALITERIEASGLSRRAVIELAQSLSRLAGNG